MAAGGVKEAAILDELEAHLREEIQERSAAGGASADAFEFAVARIGTAKSLRREFNKVSGGTFLPVVIGISVWVGMIIWVAAVALGKVYAGKWNVLLLAHVLALTAGYLATFLMGAFAICFIFLQWRGKLSSAAQTSLSRAALHFSGIAAGATVAGLILGVVWSEQNRGTYWTGSPREMGALMAVIWFSAAWLIQRFNWKDVHARMLVCMGGNILGALCWGGALVLEHDPGVRNLGDLWPVHVFIGLHLLVLALGFSRRWETAKS